MGILSWIIFGLIVGVIANMLDSRPAKGGVLGAIVLGIIGALVGGFISSILLGVDITGFNIQSIIIAVIGSMIVMFVGRSLNHA